MARAKRRPKKRTQLIDKDESDEGHDVPNPESEDFLYDDVDKFHKKREKILLQSSVMHSEEESSEDEHVEEVLGLNISSEEEEEDYKEDDDNFNKEIDEEEVSSDENDMEAGIPSEKAWGRKKKIYYDADSQKENDIDSEEEETLDKEEEEEAIALQQHIATRLDEQDFDIEEFELIEEDSTEKPKVETSGETKQEKIIKDLSKLSKEEKIQLLAKDSPELFELVNDFKEKLSEVINRLHPLVQMARSGKITNPQGIEYLEMKHQIIMNYLVNISFYLLLRTHQSSIQDHPVVERLVQYRELLQKLQPLDSQLEDDMEHYLNLYKDSDESVSAGLLKPKSLKEKKTNSKKKVKFSKTVHASKAESSHSLLNVPSNKRKVSQEDMDPLIYYEAIKEMKKKKMEERVKAHLLAQEVNIEDEEDEDIDGKRSITYQISKNKGLTPKRKKELRNPRIKHRRKFGKAKIKHKSQVLPVVKELSRYGGESTGIKKHLARSIKIK